MARLDDALRRALDVHVMSEPVMPQFRAAVQTFGPDVPLGAVLKIMAEQRYSQVVTEDRGTLRVLSHEAIVQWLKNDESRSTHDFKGLTIRDIVEREPPDTHAFLSYASTVGEAAAIFVNNPNLAVIVLVRTRRNSDAPVGIITAHDLGKYLYQQIAGT